MRYRDSWTLLPARKPVLLIQDDTHSYLVDKPLENGSTLHGRRRPVDPLVVEGKTAKRVAPPDDRPAHPRDLQLGAVFLP
jgi:hypothetical protein